MSELPQKLSRFLDLFDAVPDRGERIQLLVDTAERYRPVPERIAIRPYPETHKTPACESEVYVFAEPAEGATLRFHFAVENPQGISAMALAVILDDTLSGVPPAEVARVSGDIVMRIFGNELSMGKNMGLMGMVAMVQRSARAFLARTEGAA